MGEGCERDRARHGGTIKTRLWGLLLSERSSSWRDWLIVVRGWWRGLRGGWMERGMQTASRLRVSME